MSKTLLRCAVYTRKSTEEGLDQAFNSLAAQREACAAYVKSQASLGWRLVAKPYDDGGLSGGTMERPALQDLLEDIKAGRVDVVIVYKIDRLTRSLMDLPASSRCSIVTKYHSSPSPSSSIPPPRWGD